MSPISVSRPQSAVAARPTIVELVGRTGPALRAWAVIDANVAPGAAPLDRLGQSVLGARPGDRLRLRALRRAIVR